MRLTTPALVVLTVLFACAQEGAVSAMSAVPERPAVLASRQHTFPVAAGRALVDRCGYAVLRGSVTFWEPSATDIAALEARLPGFVRAERYPGARWGAPGVDHPARYYRQYLGVVVAGEREIVVNAFHVRHWRWHNQLVVRDTGASLPAEYRHPDFWRRQLVCVDGGGSDFFQLSYRPRDSVFTALEVNAVR